jgi:hypothetical protein
VCDLSVPEMRNIAGLHEYDGMVQDLSPSGVSAGLTRLGGAPLPDPYDDAALRVFERGLHALYGDVAMHRWNPLVHLGNLDISSYERDYAPAEVRREARLRHLAAWPEAVDHAVASLTDVSAPIARALIGGVEGLVEEVQPASGPVEEAAVAAHARFVALMRRACDDGSDRIALGPDRFAALIGAPEGLDVDLPELEDRARGEIDRLERMLDDACRRIDPSRSTDELVQALRADHPDAEGVVDEARALVSEAIDFTRERSLVPPFEGDCLVGPTPASLRFAMAMLSGGGPEEAQGDSWFWVTPPDPAWSAVEQESWLEVFSRTSLPAITVHEVAPGHFAHGRCMRQLTSQTRRILNSAAFLEGWAHYAEEMVIEEGFREDDPRYAAGVALEALIRAVRLVVSIGVHTGSMTLDEAAVLFQGHAYLNGSAGRSEAQRATYDPWYGQYTWGKLAILDVREKAKSLWGADFSLPRFHAALLSLGAPPLGLLEAALTPAATGGARS